LASQQGVAVRKSPETEDDIAVLLGIRKPLLQGRPKESHTPILIGDVFAMHERHGEEHPLVAGQTSVEPALEGAARCCERTRIALKHARRATKHVARELVQHNDIREAPARCFEPILALVALDRVVEREETIASLRVERGVLLPPSARVSEPKREDVVDRRERAGRDLVHDDEG